MALMLLRRLGMAVPTLVGVSIVIFLLMSILPGDPLAGLLAPDATPADRTALAHQMGLDQPLPIRYVNWVRDISHGDFGYSPYRRRDVSGLLGAAYQNTIKLAIASSILGLSVGLTLGTAAAMNRGRWPDRLVSSIAMGGISVPSYWMAILLIIVFSATLKWLPAGGMNSNGESGFLDYLKHVIMPAMSSSFVSIGVTARMSRASLVETYGQDFVELLRAKGLKSWQILIHVAKTAASPVITVAGLQVGVLLGGSVLVETIFSWPGVGQLIYGAIAARDFKVLQAGVLVIAVTFVLMNLFVDVMQVVLDPRLRKAA